MTDKEQYIELCAHENLPLHAQTWWIEKSTLGKEWDAVIVKNAEGRIEAAMACHIVHKFGQRAILMPIHTQYHFVYIAPDAPKDIYSRLTEAFENKCKTLHIGWVKLQGFYPDPLIQELKKCGFEISERITYRIPIVPAREEIPKLFSQNKRRQLRKAEGLTIAHLEAAHFYSLHEQWLSKQDKHIDYPREWAQAVLQEATLKTQALLLGAQDTNGNILAIIFLAWDSKWAYYLLPSYDPTYKDSGAMAWLTNEAICIAHNRGLGFDFEGSMTPSIASSYKQFGGIAETYYCIQKFYHPMLRAAIKIRQLL